MVKLPESLLQSLQGIKGFDLESFEKVHLEEGSVTSIRVNPGKSSMINNELSIEDIIDRPGFYTDGKVPWSEYGFYLKERPSFTFDPLFHSGRYYVQEASSMFLEQAFKQQTDLKQPLKILDLCAAPGGKSTHILSLISPESLLVSNEVIRNRFNILSNNIIKWGTANVIGSNNDPSAFQKLPGYFDVIVVDAPCSGSGLFRKDSEAINEWSLNNVQLCCQRQQRILADVLPSLKENGLLIYSTCSYSVNEDEDIADWLVSEFELENQPLNISDEWNIAVTQSSRTGAFSYRFYPDKLRGEGFFMSCFRKMGPLKKLKFKEAKMDKLSSREKVKINPWLKDNNQMELFFEKGMYFGFPELLIKELSILKSVLNIQYPGISIGQIMKDKLIPDHSLALSNLLTSQIPTLDLNLEESVKYLQKQELMINISDTGWKLVRYNSNNLGWANVLQNRINNYYPKELRILKQTSNS